MNNVPLFNPSLLPPNWLAATNPFPLPINPAAFPTQFSANYPCPPFVLPPQLPLFPAMTGQQPQNPIAYLAVVTPIQAPNTSYPLPQAFPTSFSSASSSAFTRISRNPTTPQIKKDDVQVAHVKQDAAATGSSSSSSSSDDALSKERARFKEELEEARKTGNTAAENFAINMLEALNEKNIRSSSFPSNSREMPPKKARRVKKDVKSSSSSSKKRKPTAQLENEGKRQNTQWQSKALDQFLKEHPEYDAAYFEDEDAINEFTTVLEETNLGFSGNFLKKHNLVRALRRRDLYEGVLSPTEKTLKEYMEKNYPEMTLYQILKKNKMTIEGLYEKYSADLRIEAISGVSNFSQALKDIGLGKAKKSRGLTNTVTKEMQNLVMEFVNATYKDLAVLKKKSVREIHDDAKEYFKKQGREDETPGLDTIRRTLKQKGIK